MPKEIRNPNRQAAGCQWRKILRLLAHIETTVALWVSDFRLQASFGFRPSTFGFIHGLLVLLAAGALSAMAADVSRERISIDDDWRFAPGDPSHCPVTLVYDLAMMRRQAEVEGHATTDINPKLEIRNPKEDQNPSLAIIKPWVLPTANNFIKDPARKFVRPEGNPGDGVAYVRPDFNDSSWQLINLPHDWAIKGPFTEAGGGGMGRLPTAGIGWYRKQLSILADDTGKSIFLDVDGAMSYSMVWLNGKFVGGWPYGYASWEVDLTPYVKPGGSNELVIRLDSPPNSSRWYPGAGIYRNVWLVKTQPVHVGQWGTYLTTPEVSAERANVDLQVTVDNNSKQDANAKVMTEIFSLAADGKKTGSAVARIGSVTVQILPHTSAVATGIATINNPKLWGPPPTQTPNRYVAVTTVSQGDKVVDIYETPFGIRTLRFDPDHGFFINGEHILLNGVCDHHDLGALGTALNYRALQRQLEILAGMGCNAIRTSHNPPAPELLELADRMGFLVMDEACDVWARQKTPLDFHLIFQDWHEPDLRAQIHRDRNCPSVILWSIGNEVGEQFTGTNGAVLARQLCDIVHEEDPTRPTTSAMNWAHPNDPLPAVVDVIGLNYQGAGIRRAPGKYPAFHKKFPDKFIFGSETTSALSSRGEYVFPVSNGVSASVGPDSGEDVRRHQVSAYELYSAAFGSSADGSRLL